MNKNTLNAAVKKYSAETGTEEEVKALISADTKGYKPEEVDEIYSAIAVPKEAGPNSKLDLSGFDYEELTGDSFKEYQKVIGGLMLYEDYDFEQYMASGVFKKEFDENLNPVEKLIGITLNKSKPVNSTRVPAHVANNMNQQIFNRDNPPSNSRYFLLKK